MSTIERALEKLKGGAQRHDERPPAPVVVSVPPPAEAPVAPSQESAAAELRAVPSAEAAPVAIGADPLAEASPAAGDASARAPEAAAVWTTDADERAPLAEAAPGAIAADPLAEVSPAAVDVSERAPEAVAAWTPDTDERAPQPQPASGVIAAKVAEITAPVPFERAAPLAAESPDTIVAPVPPASAAAPSPSVPEADVGSRVNLDFERLAATGMVTPDAARNQVAEEYRHIKRPLLLNAFGEGALPRPNRNLIMVTSARPHEGKTYTAINLALSIALERDRTVLLVDADVARPSVARVLNFPGTAGLVDFLADHDRSLGDLILQTSLPKLRILPAGRRHAHSTELLASEGMQQLAQELADRYPDRVVVFDTPPLLATSEAAVLAGLMGQVVMVVEAGKTKREELKEALALLNPDQYIGLVLNKSHRPFGTEYYYGAYGTYGE